MFAVFGERVSAPQEWVFSDCRIWRGRRGYVSVNGRGTAHPEPNPLPDVKCDLDATPSPEVRRLIRGLLAGLGGIRVEDAVLVVDELISNAHRHGSAPRACRLTLSNHGRPRRLLVEVDDASPNQPRMRTPDRTGGRGMILIDRLASFWGVHNHPDHKTVWAELALD